MSTTERSKRLDEQDADIIEVRLKDIVVFLKRSLKTMLICAVIGGILGAMYAFSLRNQYTSRITVLPELPAKNNISMGGLGSLAGLAGIDVNNISGGSDAIRPELYPNVLQSTPFALSLFEKQVYLRDVDEYQQFEKYWLSKQAPGLFDWLSFGQPETIVKPANLKKTAEELEMTKMQEVLAKALHEQVIATYDKKSGVLTITSTMPDPSVAARVASLSLNYLSDYVTNYRTEKARREVDFLANQVSIAKLRYQSAEYGLSAYRDKNRSLYLNTAKIEERRIQAEFMLSQDLYNTLSKQAEMAKIKVQEETPIFKILEPAQVPLKKSGPKRSLIVIACALIGMMCVITFRIVKQLNRRYT